MLVSVIVPCRNEINWIDRFLESVLAQRLVGLGIEILIADGASDDGTRDLLAHWVTRDQRVVVIDNPRGIVSTGLNAAIGIARGEIVVRMDVHTTYTDDYIAQCVSVLENTRAVCVGGAWRPVGAGVLGHAIAAAFASPFGSGGAKSREVAYCGPVDTVYLGAWRKADLIRLGGFDEELVRNQDDELNLRIIRSGGTVWQSDTISSSYASRASFKSVFRQFFQYGYWKVAVIQKHHLPASPRHLVPFAAIGSILGGALLAPIWPLLGLLAVAELLIYLLLAVGAASRLASPWREPLKVVFISTAFACMHGGYGLGFGLGLLDFVLLRRGASSLAIRLTR